MSERAKDAFYAVAEWMVRVRFTRWCQAAIAIQSAYVAGGCWERGEIVLGLLLMGAAGAVAAAEVWSGIVREQRINISAWSDGAKWGIHKARDMGIGKARELASEEAAK